MDWAKHKSYWPHANFSQFIVHGGHKWHVQDMGSGPILLLLHGAGGGTQSWRHLAPLLAEKYRVIMIDLPGQSFTKTGARGRFGLDDMAKDIFNLMVSQNWAPSSIIGHSAGAAIAFEIARLSPTPLPVIGINAALSNFQGVAGLLFPLMAKALANMPFVANLFIASNRRQGSVERLITGTGSHLEGDDLRYYKALINDTDHVNGTLAMMANWDLSPLIAALPQIKSQTLLIIGSEDKAVPPKIGISAAQTLPNATYSIVEGSGHLVHEENPSAVHTQIEKFLFTITQQN